MGPEGVNILDSKLDLLSFVLVLQFIEDACEAEGDGDDGIVQ